LTASEKILLVSNEFPPGPGGIGNHAYNLAKFLNKSGFKTDVLTVSDFVTQEEENEFDSKNNFSIQRHKRYTGRIKTYVERLKEIRSKANDGKYSHLIFSGRSSLLASLLTSKNEMKFVSIAHGGDVNAESALEKLLVNKALTRSDLIVPVSKFSASKITANVEERKVKIIPNGFDFVNIDELEPLRKSLIPGKLTLVSVGTVWPRKGHHNVLRVLPELKKYFPELEYNIVGRMADMSRINEVMNDEIRKMVKFHGQIDNESMQRIISASDIFILLSETQKSGDFEGFGIAAIEANYFGLPAIGSKASGLEDAINNNVSGILVDPQNKEEIVSAVNTIAENYEAYSNGAVSWAKDHHWSMIIRRYIEAIREIDG
jgi:glycosyltransferase involved in cell wall biosynthesis